MIKRWNYQYEMALSGEKGLTGSCFEKMLELGADISAERLAMVGLLLQTDLIGNQGSSTLLLLENKRNER